MTTKTLDLDALLADIKRAGQYAEAFYNKNMEDAPTEEIDAAFDKYLEALNQIDLSVFNVPEDMPKEEMIDLYNNAWMVLPAMQDAELIESIIDRMDHLLDDLEDQIHCNGWGDEIDW